MKRFLLLLLGLIPFLFGWLVNWLVMNVSVRWLNWYGVILLVIWFFFAYCFSRFAKNTAEVVLFLNFPAAAVLILIGIQELVLHAYWMNLVGRFTQMFYLPLLSIAFRLTTWSHTMFFTYCAAFLLLIAVSLVGGITRRRHIHSKQHQ